MPVVSMFIPLPALLLVSIGILGEVSVITDVESWPASLLVLLPQAVSTPATRIDSNFFTFFNLSVTK
jgi:hypothetical protein